MPEVRFGEPGLYLVGPIGSETKNREGVIFTTQDSAERYAFERCSRHENYVIYALREVSRVVLPEPTIERTAYSRSAVHE